MQLFAKGYRDQVDMVRVVTLQKLSRKLDEMLQLCEHKIELLKKMQRGTQQEILKNYHLKKVPGIEAPLNEIAVLKETCLESPIGLCCVNRTMVLTTAWKQKAHCYFCGKTRNMVNLTYL